MLISNARVEGMRTIPYKKKEGNLLKVVIRFGDGETAEATMFDDLARTCTLQPGDIIDFDGHWENKKSFDKSYNNFEIKQYWHSTSSTPLRPRTYGDPTSSGDATPAAHSGYPIESDPKLEYQFTDDDIKAMENKGAPMTSTNGQGTPLKPIKNPLKKEGIQSDNQGNGSFNGPLYGFNGNENIALDGDGTIDKANDDKATDALVEGYKNKNLIGFF